MWVVLKNCDKFHIFETKRAISAKLADILAISNRGIVSKFHGNIKSCTNSDISSEQYTVDWSGCQCQMHDLSGVRGIFPH